MSNDQRLSLKTSTYVPADPAKEPFKYIAYFHKDEGEDIRHPFDPRCTTLMIATVPIVNPSEEFVKKCEDAFNDFAVTFMQMMSTELYARSGRSDPNVN